MLNLSVSEIVRPYLDILWFGPSATADECDAYIRNMVEDATAGATIITRGVVRRFPQTDIENESCLDLAVHVHVMVYIDIDSSPDALCVDYSGTTLRTNLVWTLLFMLVSCINVETAS